MVRERKRNLGFGVVQTYETFDWRAHESRKAISSTHGNLLSFKLVFPNDYNICFSLEYNRLCSSFTVDTLPNTLLPCRL
jgi:hypothetical protein